MPTLFLPPLPDEYLAYYGTYIRLVQGEPFAFMQHTHAAFHATVNGLTEDQASARPAPSEWNIKEIVGHLSDAERIFSYRALRFARNDSTPLASMDPDAFVANGEFSTRPFAHLLDEFDTARAATLSLFQGFSDAAALRQGEASGAIVSVRALLHIIAGHEAHHLDSIRRVYLQSKQM